MAAQKKYPDELRERAVKMLFEVRERESGAWGAGRGRTSNSGAGSPMITCWRSAHHA